MLYYANTERSRKLQPLLYAGLVLCPNGPLVGRSLGLCTRIHVPGPP
jgi:hypothetical protein